MKWSGVAFIQESNKLFLYNTGGLSTGIQKVERHAIAPLNSFPVRTAYFPVPKSGNAIATVRTRSRVNVASNNVHCILNKDIIVARHNERHIR